jgi:hypothetical protein
MEHVETSVEEAKDANDDEPGFTSSLAFSTEPGVIAYRAALRLGIPTPWDARDARDPITPVDAGVGFQVLGGVPRGSHASSGAGTTTSARNKAPTALVSCWFRRSRIKQHSARLFPRVRMDGPRHSHLDT